MLALIFVLVPGNKPSFSANKDEKKPLCSNLYNISVKLRRLTMRNSSLQKEQVYQEFLTELMESSSEHKFHTSPSKPVRLFSMYIANYTSIKKIQQIDQECVKAFFAYLLKNHKRLSLSLSDIKKSIKTIVLILGIEEDECFSDFSLSNTCIWNNLK